MTQVACWSPEDPPPLVSVCEWNLTWLTNPAVMGLGRNRAEDAVDFVRALKDTYNSRIKMSNGDYVPVSTLMAIPARHAALILSNGPENALTRLFGPSVRRMWLLQAAKAREHPTDLNLAIDCKPPDFTAANILLSKFRLTA